MQNTEYDAIVVGSGISGGWAAKELTQKGLNVLVLERGKNVEHVADYVNAVKPPWAFPHRGRRTIAMSDKYPVLKRDYPLNEINTEWWANEQDAPYTEVKRFDWYRGYQVGGRSLLWGRQSYRLSPMDFEANAKDGIATPWPITYDDLAPWYDHVEKFAGIAGSKEGLAQLPDGQFQPAMPLNCAEEHVAGRLKKLYGGARRIIPRTYGQSHAGTRGARRVPVSQCLLVGLSIRRVLQLAVVDAARRREDGQDDAQGFLDRVGTRLRSRQEARVGGAGHRCRNESNHRVSREDRLPLRLHDQLDVVVDAFGHGHLACGLGE